MTTPYPHLPTRPVAAGATLLPTRPAPRLQRHDLPALKYSTRHTLATFGLVLLASASTGLRGNPPGMDASSLAHPLAE